MLFTSCYKLNYVVIVTAGPNIKFKLFFSDLDWIYKGVGVQSVIRGWEGPVPPTGTTQRTTAKGKGVRAGQYNVHCLKNKGSRTGVTVGHKSIN